MQASLALREQAAKLLAADPTTLAPAANACQVHLVMANFTPSEQLVASDLTFATFDGSTALAAGVGTQPEALDPNTNDAIIDILSPVGGWRWETTGVTNLPQTIYGFALTDMAGTTLYASAKLATPVTLSAINQRIELDEVNIRQLAGSMQ